ncbi:MAG TPA: hypothetical protein VFY29_11385 [Terriglobia bacterium]|nr:hypothetical protein [Terriglobia bacterium]
MKRLFVTTFATLYTLALIVGGVDRTSNWATEKTKAAIEKASGPGVRAQREAPKRHPNRRILQSQFVVAPPGFESEVALASTPHNIHAAMTAVWRLDGAPAPSRAPPSLA